MTTKKIYMTIFIIVSVLLLAALLFAFYHGTRGRHDCEFDRTVTHTIMGEPFYKCKFPGCDSYEPAHFEKEMQQIQNTINRIQEMTARLRDRNKTASNG